MFDDAIVGAGILGLAHAYHLAMRGRRVVVFERGPRATGASVRNFGMLWPIGQPAGEMRRMALRSLAIWTEVLQSAELWHEQIGSLHLAYREDEAQVLREFTREAAARDVDCAFLEPPQVLARSSAVRPEGLIAGMWSPTETCVDPREVIAGLAGWLSRRFGVRVVFGAAVTAYDRPRVLAGGQEWTADHLYLCAGDDLETLFPELLSSAGMVRCKLQMMRSQPDKPEIDALILRYLETFLRAPNLRIAARWHGVYAKHPTEPYRVARPAPGVTVVTGLGGAGMTLSFGLAEQVVRENLGEE
jgi:FAD dependent oxidoreductase TIGR03364